MEAEVFRLQGQSYLVWDQSGLCKAKSQTNPCPWKMNEPGEYYVKKIDKS